MGKYTKKIVKRRVFCLIVLFIKNAAVPGCFVVGMGIFISTDALSKPNKKYL